MNLFSSFAGVYSLCDSPAISNGPFLGTALLCSLASVIILSVKACVFSPISEIETDASPSPVRERLHLKISCGMPILFLSSLVFALGHTVVAYRTSCRARRKLLIHRSDPEAVCFLSQLYVQILICAVSSCLLADCHTVCILLKIKKFSSTFLFPCLFYLRFWPAMYSLDTRSLDLPHHARGNTQSLMVKSKERL